MVETINKLIRVSRQLLQELGREPTPEEIAKEMDMSVERVREILKISQEPVSLETPIGEEEDSHLGDFIQDDNVPVPADAAAFTLLKEQLVEVLSTLTDREQKVLRLRFGLDAPKIKGAQNEDNSITEGSIVFDILFRAKAPETNELITLIINVEAQKRLNPKKKTGDTYPLLKRAVYYASRLISSQKGTEFINSDYDKIKKVYTIWICMEAPQGKSAINRYQLKEQHLLHRYKEPCQNYDLMGIIFVYLGNSKVKDQLINLLDLMFKSSKDASEKITTLHNDFGIDLTQEGEGDLAVMCNLGEGLYEDGLIKGKEEGKKEGRKEGFKEGKRKESMYCLL